VINHFLGFSGWHKVNEYLTTINPSINKYNSRTNPNNWLKKYD
jgi:hypothetical protein